MGRSLEDLGTERLTWRHLKVLVTYAQPDTAIYKALNPTWPQTSETNLLRAIDYATRQMVWLWSKGGSQPEPVLWPWEEIEKARAEGAIVGDPLSWDEAAERLGWAHLIAEETRRAGH